MDRKIVGGLSFKGGRKDQFFFSLLEFYPDRNRWFLNSLLQTKGEKEHHEGDQVITDWLNQLPINSVVVDFPLDLPACQTCLLTCPGIDLCPDENVKTIQSKISWLLKQDKNWQSDNPKQYEKDRNRDEEFDHNRDTISKSPSSYLMSRSFKRRLKKGYLPYWNRPIDLWVWCHYYDQLLDIFNGIYDSFGQSSLMIQSRFNYLRRHIPAEIDLYESFSPMIMIELLRAKIITKKDIINLTDIHLGIEARLNIIKAIEHSLDIFIYDKDMENLCRHPRAFDSFLLSIAGLVHRKKRSKEIDDWAKADQSHFIAPNFSIEDSL
jgi:hypothetical protein